MGGERNETEAEEADRHYNEQLQELRVAQTGVQFLFAFLLILAFSQGFSSINEFQKWLYVGTLVVTTLSSALLIGPVPMHRILFRRGLKPRLVEATNLMARGGLALLLLAINGAVLLVLDVVLGGILPFVLSVLLTAWFVMVWYVVPFTARERAA